MEYRRSDGSAGGAPAPSRPANLLPPGAAGTDGVYIERGVALTLLLALVLGCILVLKPFVPALLWAMILSVSTWPIYVRLEGMTGSRRTLSALAMTIGVALVLLLPVVMLGVHLGETAAEAARLIRAAFASGLPVLPEWIAEIPLVGPRIEKFWTEAAHDHATLSAAAEPYIGAARDWLIALGGDLLHGIVQVMVSLFVAFFLYRDGRTAVDMLSRIATRLSGKRSGRLLQTASHTISGVVHGVLGTSLVQAILMAVALRMAGIPAVVLLGFVSFFLSLVPAGLTLLWLPASIWLMSHEATGWAVFMAIWGLFVGTIDHWLRPILIVKQSDLPLALILLGVLGGALMLGLLGIFLGPVLLAVGYSLVREWGSEHAGVDEQPEM